MILFAKQPMEFIRDQLVTKILIELKKTLTDCQKVILKLFVIIKKHHSTVSDFCHFFTCKYHDLFTSSNLNHIFTSKKSPWII